MVDVDAGMSAVKAGKKYSVSARTRYHWKALRHETGALKPRAGKTGPKPKLEEHHERILVAVRADSAITLNDLREKLRLPACVATTNAETTYVTPETLQTKPDNPQGFEMRPTSSGTPHPVSLFDNHE